LARERSPHDLLDSIVAEGDLHARLAAAVPPSERRGRLHAVDALLALALDLDGGRYANIYSFVRTLKSRALKLVQSAEPQAVQLLTVHGAKGLEAKAVFILDGDAGPARAETATLAIDWPVEAAAPRRVAFVASESKPPPALLEMLDEEKHQRQREELNALYVAMTRARSRLVISRTVGARAPAAPSWWSRLQPLADLWSVDVGQLSDLPVPTHATLNTLPVWHPPLPKASNPQDADDEALAKLGEAMHRVLEWVSGGGHQGADVARLTAASAQMYGLDAKGRERLDRSVEAILSSRDCAPFFNPAQCLWAANEVPISVAGHDRRIDRLVCLAGPTWWVLDYKLGAAPEQNPLYIEQLRAYRNAVQSLQPGETVRAALITGQGRLIDCTDLV
jgi:ATP-dependent helicase/nuclease subunit A